MEFKIDFPAFLDSLQYMGMGLIGIFAVTAIIILCVFGLNKTMTYFANRPKKKDDQ